MSVLFLFIKELARQKKHWWSQAAKKQPDNFDEISQAIAKFEKYPKEECCSHYQQISYKYFVKSFWISK